MSAARLREQWLRKLGKAMAPHIEKACSKQLPPWRVSCGFPSTGGRKGGKKWTRGECWDVSASADGHAEIFINPGIDDADTVAAILAHELIHACLGAVAGHKRPFQIAAANIGHAKPFTSANPTDAFWAWARELVTAAGEYPHKELRTARPIGAPKAQKGRQIKAACAECGYTVRLARKWIEEAGTPICPREDHGPMVCEAPGEDDADLIAVIAGIIDRNVKRNGMEPGL